MASRSPSSRSSQGSTSKSSSAIPRNPHSWSLISASSNSSRFTSCGSRPLTGEHLLEWYIPPHIAGSAYRRREDVGPGPCDTQQGTNKDKSDSEKKAGSTKTNHPSDENAHETIPSPLHNDSKQEWTTRYTDEKIRSLPIPPPYKPKILDFTASHADNLPELFRKALAESNCIFYSRYGIPMVPLACVVPNYRHAPNHMTMWNSSASSCYKPTYVPPPPQSMFTFAGGPQRRHFSVAPDWRRIR